MLESYFKGNKVYKELPFYTEISATETDKTLSNKVKDENIRIQGVIDCFFYDDDNKVILLDYKTDYVEEGNEEEIVNKYRIQLKYYKEALEKITKVEDKECYLYLFYLGKDILVEI